MSRVGKQTIIIPSGTEVNLSGDVLTVKGPKGSISKTFKKDVSINIDGNQITFTPKKLDDKKVQYDKDIISSTPDLKQFGIDTKEDGLNTIVRLAIEKYISEVKLKQFPSSEYNYPIKDNELENVMKSKLWVL